MLFYNFNTIKFSPYTSVIMLPNSFPHTQTFWKITYAIEGESEQITNGVKRTLSSSTILIVKPNSVHQNINYSSKDYKHRDIYVPDEKMREICSFFPKDTYDNLCKDTPFFKITPISFSYLESILNLFPVNSSIKNEYLDSLHFTVVANIISLFLSDFANTYTKPRWILDLINRMNDINYLQNNVSHLIADIPYSHGYICREFMKYCNSTLSNFLIKAKIIYSSNLLLDKNLSITDIAYKLGFSSESSYIKSFNRYFNISPGKYRKINLSKVSISPTTIWGKNKNK